MAQCRAHLGPCPQCLSPAVCVTAHAEILNVILQHCLDVVTTLLAQYAELAEEEREAWVKEQGADSALPKIITTGFKAIHLIYFFTAGADEVKCWQIRKASKAPQVRPPGQLLRGNTLSLLYAPLP
eukprot:GHRQ01026109.1.p1 GENE.GHRQ01026109.1~~GHRQ01026109.1.p1  ORF type:complete len:126 (-),score=41.10 GHRQ01026109.1:422-799(-)